MNRSVRQLIKQKQLMVRVELIELHGGKNLLQSKKMYTEFYSNIRLKSYDTQKTSVFTTARIEKTMLALFLA